MRHLVEKTLDRLREFEPEGGYYGAFSGGKDSCVIKALAEMAGVKVDWHYHVSGIDPPELVRFIRDKHSDVEWDRFAIPFPMKLVSSGFPLRHRRWCCKLYKEAGGRGRLVMTGIRWAESGRRKQRNMVESCYNIPGKRFLHVIIDWTDEDVWDFLKGQNIPYCHLYDEGWDRLGCICCPFKSAKMKRKELDMWPRFEYILRRAFNKLYDKRVSQGRDSVSRWKNGDEMFEWWISNDKLPPKPTEGMFD